MKKLFKISGNHAIKEIINNPNRNVVSIHGSVEFYKNIIPINKINVSKENYVFVNEIFVESSLHDIIKTYNRIILVDKMEDTRNLGSIIRSAAILGYAVLIREEGCGITPMVVQCASGGTEQVKIHILKNTKTSIDILKNNGFWFLSLSEKKLTTISKTMDIDKLAIVIGCEFSGISKMIFDCCDFNLMLSGNDKFNIYNASVAASIAMYNYSLFS